MNYDDAFTLYIPGGPWISGEYWDIFLDFYDPHRFRSARYCLLNHEDSYRIDVKTNLKEQILDLKKSIRKVSPGRKINVVAHSYGAWLYLLSLDAEIEKLINKSVLVDMPKGLERSDAFLHYIKKHAPIPPSDNETFISYFKAISPLYFSGITSDLKLFSTGYMKGNEDLLLKSEEIDQISRKLKNHSRHIFINGSEDQLIEKEKVVDGTYLIENSGHFPMLEQEEKFSQLLSSILKQTKPKL
jgi:pimeloyl-ACP methyl ester carboxylesterase